ncbi:SIS domain-containing protein [Kineococcus sp. SYSU DK003]|uniref:SIS domain-containing protein n=1 Tax=Kineococcus sp. SYSU DK003 TaxID=3383124 RepID=UPI003D7CA6C5
MSDDLFIPYRDAMADQAASLDAVVARVTGQLPAAAELLRASRPVFTGIGASLAAAAAPVHTLRTRGVPAHRVGVGDLPAGGPALGDAVVAVSQSGRSAETVAVQAALHGRGDVLTAAVVNVPSSPVTQVSQVAVDLGAQRDSKASTIGFTGTLAALGLLADAWDAPVAAQADQWARLGSVLAEFDSALGPTVEQAADLIGAAVCLDVAGEQAGVAAAESGALLLREVSRIPATAFELRNYLHGPTESAHPTGAERVTGHLLVGGPRSAELAQQLAGFGAPVVLLADSSVGAGTVPGVLVIELPALPEAQRAVVATVVMQRLSLELADRAGHDPDEFVFSSADTKVDTAVPSGSR